MKKMVGEKCKWCLYEDVCRHVCSLQHTECDKDTLGGEDCKEYMKCSPLKWGSMRRRFLKENYPFEFEEMMLNNTMHEHLVYIEKYCNQMMEDMTKEQLKKEPLNNDWNELEKVQHINQFRMMNEEWILSEIVYKEL